MRLQQHSNPQLHGSKSENLQSQNLAKSHFLPLEHTTFELDKRSGLSEAIEKHFIFHSC